jgi:hypothetical protein
VTDLPRFLSDGEDYWRLEPETGLYRILDLEGEPYHWATHPAADYDSLVAQLPTLRVVEEIEVVWRTIKFVMSRLDKIPGI